VLIVKTNDETRSFSFVPETEFALDMNV